ncbi:MULTISPECIES: hypothetical protein [Rheinheimera]|uniref:Uncharacterized protein n=1 Tax=Rheinheimera marina TaxID=1774958 RepID=A0ABV9JRU3_9GAMM
MSMVTEHFLNACNDIAANFRIGHNIQAQQALPALVEALIQSVEGQDAEKTLHLLQLVKSIRECQERHDWLGLADYLQFELAELLSQFN